MHGRASENAKQPEVKESMMISLDPPSTPSAGTLPMVRRLSTSVLRQSDEMQDNKQETVSIW